MKNFSASEHPKTTSSEESSEIIQTSTALELTSHTYAEYPTLFISFALPHYKPSSTVVETSTKDYFFTLSASAYHDYDGSIQAHLPYGMYARTILMYITTAVRENKSPRIKISKTLRGFVRDLGLEWNGANGRAVLHQLRSLLALNVTLTRLTPESQGKRSLGSVSCRIGTEEKLHFEANGDLDDEKQSVVIISQEFFNYLCPEDDQDRRTVSVLLDRWSSVIRRTRSPLAADVLLWLSTRLYGLTRDTLIPWESLHSQFGGAITDITDFKKKFRAALRIALQEYPQAQVSERGHTRGKFSGTRGIVLHPSPPISTLAPISKIETQEDIHHPEELPSSEIVPPSSEVYRGVDLTQLRADLSTVGITTEGTSDTGLQRAIGTILTRAASPVGSPQRYVTVAITADPTLLTNEALTAAAIRAATHREAPSPGKPATEGNSSLPTGGICSICYDPYNGAVCPSCAAELISAEPIPADILTELWEALKEQLQGAGHNPGSSLYTRYENAYQYHTQHHHA